MEEIFLEQRQQIEALLLEKDAQEQILQKMYVKVQKLNEEISLLSRALDIKMSDMGTQLGFPLQKKDFVDVVANLDTDGIRAYDATFYQTQISGLNAKLQRA